MNPQAPYRALVVDDEPLVRQATIRALANGGFSCEAASDGREAFEKAQQSRFDVVVTDLHMPVANGHKLAVDLLGMPERPAIVILTGIEEPKLARDLRVRGVDEILFKPVDFGVLVKKIVDVVAQRSMSISSATTPQGDGSPVVDSKTIEATPPKLTGEIAAPIQTTVELPAPPHLAAEPVPPSAAQWSTPDLASEFVKLQSVFTRTERKLALQSVAIFFAGLVVGWLLTWLGPASSWVKK